MPKGVKGKLSKVVRKEGQEGSLAACDCRCSAKFASREHNETDGVLHRETNSEK